MATEMPAERIQRGVVVNDSEFSKACPSQESERLVRSSFAQFEERVILGFPPSTRGAGSNFDAWCRTRKIAVVEDKTRRAIADVACGTEPQHQLTPLAVLLLWYVQGFDCVEESHSLFQECIKIWFANWTEQCSGKRRGD